MPKPSEKGGPARQAQCELIAPAADQFRFKSSMLALVVHAGFFALLIFGITWQAKEPAGVVVDLWADLPAAKPVVQAPVVKPPVNKPETPPPEPEPVKKVVPKPIPPTPTKTPDIALKEKRIQETKRKQDLAQQEQLRQDQIKQEQTRLTEMARQQQAQAELTRRAQAQQAAEIGRASGRERV